MLERKKEALQTDSLQTGEEKTISAQVSKQTTNYRDGSRALGESVTVQEAQLVSKHDAKLHFDEELHKYTLAHNDKECISVTTLLDQIFPSFDADKCLSQFYRNWQSPAHPKYKKYGGKTEKEIKEMWESQGKESRDKGTEMHKQIENMFRGEPADLDPVIMSGLRKFLRSHSSDLALGVQGVEVRLVDPQLRLAGTADLLARGITGGLTLVDWKRSTKDLREDSNSFGAQCGSPLAPAHEVPANAYFKYALQLNLYKRLLEDNYECGGGGVVDKLFVVQLHPDLPEALRVVQVPILAELVDCIMQWRQRTVAEEDAREEEEEEGDVKVGSGNSEAESAKSAKEGTEQGVGGASSSDGGGEGVRELAAMLAETCTLRPETAGAGDAEEEEEEEWT